MRVALAAVVLGVVGCRADTGTDTAPLRGKPDASVVSPDAAVDAEADAGAEARDASDASVDAIVDAGSTDAAASLDADAMMVRPRRSLVDHLVWTPLTAAEDPFDDRVEGLCEPGQGFFVEDFGGEPSLSVGTLYCDYLAVAQPSLVDIVKGEQIVMRLWQYTLTAPSGAELHMALYVGDEQPWDARVTIPRESGLMKATWTAERDLPKGTRIVFHLHNHGDNQYNLIELSTGAADESR